MEPNPPAPAEMLPLESAEAVAVEDAEDVEGAEEVDVNRSPDSISFLQYSYFGDFNKRFQFSPVDFHITDEQRAEGGDSNSCGKLVVENAVWSKHCSARQWCSMMFIDDLDAFGVAAKNVRGPGSHPNQNVHTTIQEALVLVWFSVHRTDHN